MASCHTHAATNNTNNTYLNTSPSQHLTTSPHHNITNYEECKDLYVRPLRRSTDGGLEREGARQHCEEIPQDAVNKLVDFIET